MHKCFTINWPFPLVFLLKQLMKKVTGNHQLLTPILLMSPSQVEVALFILFIKLQRIEERET